MQCRSACLPYSLGLSYAKVKKFHISADMQSVVVPYEARDNAVYNEFDAEVANIMREDQIIEEYLYNNQLPERNHQGK